MAPTRMQVKSRTIFPIFGWVDQVHSRQSFATVSKLGAEESRWTSTAAAAACPCNAIADFAALRFNAHKPPPSKSLNYGVQHVCALLRFLGRILWASAVACRCSKASKGVNNCQYPQLTSSYRSSTKCWGELWANLIYGDKETTVGVPVICRKMSGMEFWGKQQPTSCSYMPANCQRFHRLVGWSVCGSGWLPS
jgi:hypothetical protein